MRWSKAISIAHSKKQQRQYKEALRYYKKALEIAQRTSSQNEEAQTLFYLGDLCLSSLENYNEAVKYYKQGLVIVQEIDDKTLESKMCSCLSGAYMRLGQYDLSERFCKQALNIALRLGDLEVIAHSFFALGNAYLKCYQYQNSIKCFKKAIDNYKQLGDEKGLGCCYGNISLVYQEQQMYSDAIHYHQKCATIANNLHDKKLQAHSYLNLGRIHAKLKNNAKAVDFYKKCLDIALVIKLKDIQQFCYGSLGSIFSERNNYKDALLMFFNQLEIVKELQIKESLAVCLLNISKCYFSLYQYKNGIEHYNKSLAIAKEIDAKDIEALAYFNIGSFHVRSGELQEAMTLFEKSLNIVLSIGEKEGECALYNNLGGINFLLSKEDHETYMSYISKSQEYLQKALHCHDYLFKHLKHYDHFKISKFDEMIVTYKLLTSVHIEKQQLEEALLVSDRGRARALGERLNFAYGVSEEECWSSKPLTYSDVEKVLSNNAFTLLHYSLLDDGLAVWVLTKDSGVVFKEIDKQQFISAVETLCGEKNKEQEDTVLNRFFADTVDRAFKDMNITEEVTCENRSLDDDIPPTDQQCDGGTDSVSRDDTGGEKAEPDLHPLEVLYNTLIAPVLPHVQHDEIVIVPDGKMYRVPFAALKDPNTGKYLSESKRIRLAPSIAVLKLLQECPVDHHNQCEALIVGNPGVGKVNFRGNERLFKPLKCAQSEAVTVADVLREGAERRKLQPNITLLTEQQATKDAVLAKMKEGTGIIHIAAHGSVDHGEILLAPCTSQDRQSLPEEQDYLLTMKLVQEVGVKAQLVVLSCCHSGQGEIRAEGMIGLSRAFLAAGARAVVASLWSINDKVTYYFMVTFYESLCRGHSASVSLKHAVKFLRTHPIYSDVKHWAPFFLIGDDVTINFEE